MKMDITFPGKKKVDAYYKGFTIHTDQPLTEGGDGEASEPFSLFLASIGTCTGIYILSFLQERNLPTHGLNISLEFTKNHASKLIEKIMITIQTPPAFPKQYENALIKVANLCTVKRHLDNPPNIEIAIQNS
jgi:ribosomal protein S12 methylthiotransferase accessory factor